MSMPVGDCDARRSGSSLSPSGHQDRPQLRARANVMAARRHHRRRCRTKISLYRGVTPKRGVCGPSCVFTNVLTPRAGIERKDEFLPTRVGRGATIGANATIVCGVELGPYCMVAAGAVVSRDVPAFALVAGVPARRIGWVSRAGERLGDDLVCPRTGECYLLAGGKLEPADAKAAS